MKRIHHVCIQSNCYEASLKFYCDILGFKVVKETPHFHGRYFNTWLESEGFMIELQTPKVGEDFSPYNKNANGIVHMCFKVQDLSGALNEILEKGHQDFKLKNNEILYSVEAGSLFKVIAPEGTEIEFRNT